MERSSLPNLVIRECLSEELQKVAEIEKLCFKDPYPIHLLAMLRALYPELFLVAIVDNNIVGYVSAIVRREQVGHIVSICVHPMYRRRGIGTMLMKEVERRLREMFSICTFRLEVRVSNTPAISMYQKLGYRIVERLPRYYQDGEDAYMMIKDVCIEKATEVNNLR
ncbi:MAG TPA: ribosomal-protein-alanine N-acetyltransferase [Ignisphaera aggregans]|uniref:Ribosomal-protein-alanine N-acetyltransferase n=1 Tax=Ignisphaera aggregans TaxID=334771 RepID=A0A832YZ72_9CREN|nr:ribosomal-protein-alanine N-acetyltransferase [Ignisphaera aggregans]